MMPNLTYICDHQPQGGLEPTTIPEHSPGWKERKLRSCCNLTLMEFCTLALIKDLTYVRDVNVHNHTRLWCPSFIICTSQPGTSSPGCCEIWNKIIPLKRADNLGVSTNIQALKGRERNDIAPSPCFLAGLYSSIGNLNTVFTPLVNC